MFIQYASPIFISGSIVSEQLMIVQVASHALFVSQPRGKTTRYRETTSLRIQYRIVS